jgi:hypothetical protein
VPAFAESVEVSRAGWRLPGSPPHPNAYRTAATSIPRSGLFKQAPRRHPSSELLAPRSQVLPEAADHLHLLEVEGAVGLGADFIVSQGIGCEFAASLVPRPSLRRGHERAAHSQPPKLGDDIPALEKAHRAGLTPLGIRPARDLGESSQERWIFSVYRYEHRLGHGTEARTGMVQVSADLGRMARVTLIRPESGTQLGPLRGIPRLDLPD